MITIRRLVADDWRAWRQLRLDALRDAPGAFTTKLAEWQGDGDTEERWRDRLSAVRLNVIADLDGKPAGMVSALQEGDDVELISMWVAAFARGRGVGDALIDAVLGWEVIQPTSQVGLCVMEGNHHAAALYRRHGFVDGTPGQPAGDGGCVERRMTRF